MIVDTDFFMSDRWNNIRLDNDVVVISGGFDPIHIGHLKYIIESAKIGDILIAVVNGDGFLNRKKKYNFMAEFERAMIVDHIKGVDYTLIWDDGTQFVDGALRLVKPNIFCKGGDRNSANNMPAQEISACEKFNIKMQFGVGGFNKLNSSSELAENMQKLEIRA